IILPVQNIWTPDLTVENAIYVSVKPATNDIVVKSDGTVNYAIAMYTTVVCKLNLLTYPFVQGACPIAINGWNQSSCGLNIQYGSVSSVGGDGSEWNTVSVNLKMENSTNNQNYINVNHLFILPLNNPFNALVSLVLPTALIMITDLVSFALPLDGGKRSSFKITLVLSFTMFLVILTDYLPNSGSCSPLIRYHFCFCMFVLVLSMLISMVCTKLAAEGNIFCRRFPKLSKQGRFLTKMTTINIRLKLSQHILIIHFADMIADGQSIKKIVNFVEKMDKQSSDIKYKKSLAAKLDKISFFSYICLDVIYSLCVIVFAKSDSCKVDNLDFW
ncbi:5-hydroxytryptamine receptor 3A-like, partial [Silurus meridionalis]